MGILIVAGCTDRASDADDTAQENAVAQTASQAPLPDLADRVILAGCRQGQCGWSRVVRLERLRSTPDGELRRLVARRGLSRYGFDEEPPSEFSDGVEVEWEPQDRSAYAFCSTTRPAYAFADEQGGLILHRLDLYNLAGYQLASGRMYMHICHGRDLLPDTEPAAKLGYRPGTPSEQVEVGSPDEILR